MKKREFLAMSGAVPLMLAGCGDGTGNAPVRLINASVGYQELGFLVQTTQATKSNVAYGEASPFETVQAGSVTTALTVPSADGTTNTAVSSTTRTLDKESRYSLVAFGFPDELQSLLVTESTVTPDSGEVNINVLNTSLDIGAVDVYLSTTAGTDLSVAQQISSSVGGESQSSFFPTLPGSYFITVVGAGSVLAGRSDIRFTSPSAFTVTNQQVVTIILTPGASGTLANVIVLTQGTAGIAPISYLNTTARLRVVTAVPKTTTVSVTGVLPASTGPQPTNYIDVSTGALPSTTVTASAGAAPDTFMPAGTLVAGGDYTLLVYTDTSGNNPTSILVMDDNTAPTTTSGVKYRLINAAYDNPNLSLRMTVNSSNVASGVTFGQASPFLEIATPQNIASVVQIFDGADLLVVEPAQTFVAGNIFTEVVVSVSADTPPVVKSFILSTSGATS